MAVEAKYRMSDGMEFMEKLKSIGVPVNDRCRSITIKCDLDCVIITEEYIHLCDDLDGQGDVASG